MSVVVTMRVGEARHCTPLAVVPQGATRAAVVQLLAAARVLVAAAVAGVMRAAVARGTVWVVVTAAAQMGTMLCKMPSTIRGS